jgi:hypothetical protein
MSFIERKESDMSSPGAMRAAEAICACDMWPANGHTSKEVKSFSEIIDRETHCSEMIAVIKEAEEHSQKRLPVKKSTWLKMVDILRKVEG